MLHCNVQYLHDQLIPFAAVINLLMVAPDDAAGIRMVIPINCMVTISSAVWSQYHQRLLVWAQALKQVIYHILAAWQILVVVQLNLMVILKQYAHVSF